MTADQKRLAEIVFALVVKVLSDDERRYLQQLLQAKYGVPEDLK
jgi:hypothetical protein